MRKIKELLKLISKECLGNSGQSSVDEVVPTEILSRFLFSKSQCNSSRVKPPAFEPKFQDESGRFETSVFRKTHLGGAYKNIKETISKERGKRIKAVALIKTSGVSKAEGLTVESEESKHRGHANIIGWPSEKSERMQLLQILAANSSLE